jgi:hypothetical protein
MSNLSLSKIIPTRLRNESIELLEFTYETPDVVSSGIPQSPVSSVDTDTNSVSIQIHESYDIRNDDINEEYSVSYQKNNVSFRHEPTTYNEQTQIGIGPVVPDSPFDPLSYEDTGVLPKQELRRSVGVRKITGEDSGSPSTSIASKNPSSPSNTRSKLVNAFLMSHSPLSSHTNSDAELSDNENADPPLNATNSQYLIQEHVENAITNRKMHFKKISYEEIERSLSKYYDKNNKYSNEVDILITFIRGQKHLYNQSCYITQLKLYSITISALVITSLITVVTPFIQKYWWKIIFVMSGNAITTALITILKYMQYESACNTFTLLSNHYEHYEQSLQITNNKLVFIKDETAQTKLVLDKMQEVEFKMRETKELCPVIIPVEVQNTFPVIYQTNIFSLIRKMENHRKSLILQLKNIKNEIRYIMYKWNNLSRAYIDEEDTNTNPNENTQLQKEKAHLLSLMDQKEKIKKELIEYKDNYSQIDDLFMKEIKYAERNKKCWKWLCCNEQKIQYNSYTNPVMKEHLELILS